MTNPPQPPEDDDSTPPETPSPPPPPSGESPPPGSPGNYDQPGGYSGPLPGSYPSPGGYPPPGNSGQPGGYPPPGNFGQPGGYPPPPPTGNYPPPGNFGAPPPPGNYGAPPPPPPGSYPPPPQGGYGAQGYYPPPAGYPQQGGHPGYPQQGGYPGYPQPGGYGGGPQVDVGAAFKWVWNKFSKNAAALIVPTLVYAIVVGVVYGIFYALAMALAPDRVSSYDSSDSGVSYSFSSNLGAASIAMILLGGLVTFVVAGAISSAYYAGLLEIADRRPVTIGSFFKPRNVGSVLVASLIIGLLTTIGQFLCFLPGLVVSLFTIFTLVSIVDRNLPPIDALKASFEMVKSHFGQVLLAWLVIVVLVAVGAVLCGVGLLVAVPLAGLFLVHTYRTLGGGAIAEPTA